MLDATKAKWNIDSAHSDIHFSARYMMLSKVSGQFKSFKATILADNDEDFINSTVTFEIDVDSIFTNEPKRDQHLLAEEFFYAENHPKIIFKSTSWKEIAIKKYQLTGDLTMRGVTKSIDFEVTYYGQITDPYGKTKAGFEVLGSVNRKEFGLDWQTILERGGVVLGDVVNIEANLQLELEH